MLEGAKSLATSEETAARIEGVQETLFPEGRGITQRTYAQQAGTAKRVRQRMTDDDRALLAEINVMGTPLTTHVDAWLELALTISEKAALRAELTSNDNDDAVTAGEVRNARNRWMQSINSLLHMLKLADVDERDQAVLLANLKETTARATAARLRAQARNDRDQAEAEADEEPEVPEPAE